jgi:transposase
MSLFALNAMVLFGCSALVLLAAVAITGRIGNWQISDAATLTLDEAVVVFGSAACQPCKDLLEIAVNHPATRPVRRVFVADTYPSDLSGHSGTACWRLRDSGWSWDAPSHEHPGGSTPARPLWQRIQPLLPPAPARPRGGIPRRVPDRNCVAALVFMARTSTPWSLLPAKELGCGSATTCWRRMDEWARAGVFDQLQAVLLDELGEAGRVDLERVSVDSFSLRAVKGGT